MDPAEQRRWDLAWGMYQQAQAAIERLSELSTKIKSWCLAVWALLFGAGVEFRNGTILAGALLAILLFWWLDVHYKFFHEQFLRISANIERRLQRGTVAADEVAGLMFSNNLSNRILRDGKLHPCFARIFRRAHFHVLYGSLLLLTAGGLVALWRGW